MVIDELIDFRVDLLKLGHDLGLSVGFVARDIGLNDELPY